MRHELSSIRSMRWPVVAAGACVLAVATAAARPVAAQEDLATRLRAADLIFRGTVVSVDHRLSEVDDAAPDPVPHTFVTYRVSEVLKGSVDGGGDTLTLRFIGGPIDRDNFLIRPGQPLFDRGDSDLLLVRGNTQTGCPLVGCEQGRFRFLEGGILSEDGLRVRIGPGGTIEDGPAVTSPAIETNDMSETIHLRRMALVDPDAPATARESEADPPPDPQLDPTPERFLELMRGAVQASHTPEELERARESATPSADVAYPFYMPRGRVATSRVAESGPGEPEPALAAEPEPSVLASASTTVAPAAPPEASAPRVAAVPARAPFALSALGLGALALSALALRRLLRKG